MRFLLLIWFSTAVDFVCGWLLDLPAEASPWQRRLGRRRRLLLGASLVTNLGLLGFFKYFDFFAAGAAAGLRALGMEAEPWSLGLVLPVGISFYTLQTMGYTIDVWAGRQKAERDPLNFALFVAFFPQLVAGPIERASRLLPQLRAPVRVTWQGMCAGGWLVGWGLFKKVVLADNLARIVEPVYSAADPGAGAIIAATWAFALQIYCDFSGYCDMARGLARWLGFDISINFNLPYFSPSPREFWRRWHITLSAWLRDYLYIPLGGSRRGPWRNRLALLTTMLLGGLWHGAGAGFLLWGLYHGLLLIGQRTLAPAVARCRDALGLAGRLAMHAGGVVLTFQLVCFGWLLFRAGDGRMLRLFGNLLVDGSESLTELAPGAGPQLAAAALALLLMQGAQATHRDLAVVWRFPVVVRAAIYSALMLAFLWLGEFGGEPFIYFQF